MRKISASLLVFIYLQMLFAGLLFSATNQMDDLGKSFQDLERSLEQDSLRNNQWQKDYQTPQQAQPLSAPPAQKVESFDLEGIPQDKLATDRAITRNEERLNELIEEQKRQMFSATEEWTAKVPKQYRLIVELSLLTLFVTILGLIFYKMHVKKEEGGEGKVEAKDKSSGDGITFYDVK